MAVQTRFIETLIILATNEHGDELAHFWSGIPTTTTTVTFGWPSSRFSMSPSPLVDAFRTGAGKSLNSLFNQMVDNYFIISYIQLYG